MSYYYKYNFVSPEPIFAEVKEELRSYFDTGVVDDILFPRYVEDCLKRLGRSSYKIVNNVFKLENYTSKLPADFEAVREIWLCTSSEISYKLPTARYEQTSFRVTPDFDRCTESKLCAPEVVKVTYKTTGEIVQNFKVKYLLKPGNISVRDKMASDCLNFCSDTSDTDTFDIRDNKIVTNFPEGTLYIVYYVNEYDDNDYQMIPENIRIKDYLKSYLKFKTFETVWNNVTDESFNQVQSKFQYYEKTMWEAKIIAEVEIKKQTIHQVVHSIKRQRTRFRNFNIS